MLTDWFCLEILYSYLEKSGNFILPNLWEPRFCRVSESGNASNTRSYRPSVARNIMTKTITPFRRSVTLQRRHAIRTRSVSRYVTADG